MSQAISSVSSQPYSATQEEITPPVRMPAFLATAEKAIKFVLGIVVGIIGLGSTAIGITLAPFIPQIGVGALALGATFFAISGSLIYSANTASNLNLESIEVLPRL